MKETRRPFFKTADWILIGGLLVVAAVAFLLLRRTPTGGVVEVQVDGTIVATLPLDVHNTLVIADGKATIIEATCPDGVCVRHRAIDKAGQSIICLPNKVVVRVVGEPIVDAEAG